jgi:prepilin-type N-terminal cleavage/methylation domain-containing protein
MSNRRPGSHGFTLVELMIAIAILSVIAVIAVPAYLGYIKEARLGTLRMNLDTLRVPLEDYRLDNGNYGTTGTTYTDATIKSQFGWEPGDGEADYSYSVRAYVIGSSVTYDAWAKDNVTTTWLRCDNRMSKCCDGSGSVTACP